MKYPGMIVHSIGVILAGAWIVSITINTIWPKNDMPDKTQKLSLLIKIY